jgi:hypothetical protein
MKQYDVLALFSGGLDSILAASLMSRLGHRVLCLHFVSPFFGHPDRAQFWRETFGLDITVIDVGQEFLDMMLAGPKYGVGQELNPCVDCKILMLKRCKELLPEYGAKFIVTGEVKGQRPMSQRADALQAISRDAGVRSLLLRPLSAKLLKPTPMEENGLVDREKLQAMNGRGRGAQMQLAAQLGLGHIPQPAGGCRLTMPDSAKRYVSIFRHAVRPEPEYFGLANVGRQFWAKGLWLAMGRNQADNQALEELAEPTDYTFHLRDFPGPFGLARPVAAEPWTETALAEAAGLVASFCPKIPQDAQATVLISHQGLEKAVSVTPSRRTALGFAEPDWNLERGTRRELFGLK